MIFEKHISIHVKLSEQCFVDQQNNSGHYLALTRNVFIWGKKQKQNIASIPSMKHDGEKNGTLLCSFKTPTTCNHWEKKEYCPVQLLQEVRVPVHEWNAKQMYDMEHDNET